jgi:chorismate mutase
MKLPINPEAVGLEWPEYSELQARRAKVESRLNEAGARAYDLRHSALEAARTKDREVFATALVGGSSKTVAPTNETKVESELAQDERLYEALEVALQRLDAELADLVSERAPRWAEEVATATEEAANRYRSSVERLLAARARYGALERLRYFLENPLAPGAHKAIPPDFQAPVTKTTHHGMFTERVADVNEIAALLMAEVERSQ